VQCRGTEGHFYGTWHCTCTEVVLFSKSGLMVFFSSLTGKAGNSGVAVARDDEVRDSVTKMMTTKDSGMAGVFHNLGNISLRTILFLLISTIAILLVISVSIGLICRVQVKKKFPRNQHNMTWQYKYFLVVIFQCSTRNECQIPSSPKIEREGGASLSTSGSFDKLLDASSSENSLPLMQCSAATTSTSIVLNDEDEALMNDDPEVILQQRPGRP
jgi:hypothetical protein